MIKLSYWRPSLTAYLVQCRARPFKWGEHDCALFVCGAIEAMTGEDLAKPYRGRYRSAAGGLKLIKKDGYKDHAEFAAALLTELDHPSQAAAGDIIAYQVEGGTGIALGIVNNDRSYVLAPDGITTVPTLSAVRLFRIP
jgi:hypothetical protein